MKYFFVLLMFFVIGHLFAEEIVQNITEKYLSENGAINAEKTEVTDSKVSLDGKLFTGFLFARYDNHQIKTLEHYKNGLLHGSSARWYRNGQKQMEAIFKNGKLNGYFKGWFENGDLKYDYNFSDPGREEDSIQEEEKDGDSASGQKDS